MSDYTPTPSGSANADDEDEVEVEETEQDTSAFAGVDPIYQNYASHLNQPMVAEGDSKEAKAEREARDNQREAAEKNASTPYQPE